MQTKSGCVVGCSMKMAQTQHEIGRAVRQNAQRAQHCRTQSELKQRLLIISKTEHPDHGGDPERWRKLHGAYVFLHERLKPELSQSYDLK